MSSDPHRVYGHVALPQQTEPDRTVSLNVLKLSLIKDVSLVATLMCQETTGAWRGQCGVTQTLSSS